MDIPPGDPVPINVEPFNVRDETPEDVEIRKSVLARLSEEVVLRVLFSSVPKTSKDGYKTWKMEDEEDPEKPVENAGTIADMGNWPYIPTQMLWVVIVLIPKGTSGDFRGIGLLEPFWKTIECIIDDRLNVVDFNDCLHGFVKKRGCGTAGIEAKLLQQLSYLQQTPLFGIFIDLRKAYDAMDRDRCVEILKGYGVGPNILRLIVNFWDSAELVCRASGRYGAPFKAKRGVTQGGPLSPKLFNIMVDAIVREWLRVLFEDEDLSFPKIEIEGVVKLFTALFYADDGYIASTDDELLQRSMDILTGLFDRVGLRTNVGKTKVMTCIDSKIRVRDKEEVYYNRRCGFYTERDWNRRRVECDICGQDLSANSLASHLETQHGVFRSRVLDRDFLLEEREAEVFDAEDSPAGYHCPVGTCPGGPFTHRWNLRRHFCARHPLDLVNVPGEGVLPKCERCGMQTNFVNAPKHEQSKLCREGREKIVQNDAAVTACKALDVVFTAYGEDLERVEVFKYLGRLLSMDDTDVQSIRGNLKKAKKVWKMLSRLLRGENLASRVCGMFYKAVVQAVLLYGSETWAITPSAMRCLKGFHFRAACRMAEVNKPRKNHQTGSWVYPSREELFEEVGLYTIHEYIEKRRQSIATYIIDRPIFDLCVEGQRKRGISPRLWWWEQSMDLDLAREGINAPSVVAGDDLSVEASELSEG